MTLKGTKSNLFLSQTTYRLDKNMNNRRQFVPTQNKNKHIMIMVVVIAVVLIFSFAPSRNIVRAGANFIGTGILRVTHGVGGFFSNIGTSLRLKSSLEKENQDLKNQLSEINTKLLSYDSVVAENFELKTGMGRTDNLHFILATILSKPSKSLYDTLVIDGGENASIVIGQTVYANSEVPIGTIESVEKNSAIVRLFSSPKTESEGRLDVPDEKGVKHIDITLVGRGGGNFQTTVPHDLVVPISAQVFSRDIKPRLIAVFQKITSDARDPFQTLLLTAPVNIQELNFVQVGQ